MEVLHINRNYLTSPLHQVMLEHLDRTSAQNTVFAPTEDLTLSVIKPNSNVIARECFTKTDRFFYKKKQKKIRTSLLKSLEVSNFDLIHAYTLFTDGNCAMELSHEYKIPYIVTIRNTDVNDFFRKIPWLRMRGINIMKNASRVIFLSPTYREQVFDLYIPKKERAELYNKTEIIPNGIDDYWLQNQDLVTIHHRMSRINNKKLRVIYAGRIDRNKNILSTVEALKLLYDEGWEVEFTIVGKIADEKIFQQITRTSFVHYVPAQPKDQLKKLYHQNDIFVMPSYTETFGLVYAEAMSQGLPVVYSQGQGFDGQFKEGTVGYHADSNDVLDIKKAIKRIIKEYESISQRCPDLAQRFNWTKIVGKYEEIYNQVLSKDAK